MFSVVLAQIALSAFESLTNQVLTMKKAGIVLLLFMIVLVVSSLGTADTWSESAFAAEWNAPSEGITADDIRATYGAEVFYQQLIARASEYATPEP